MDIIKKYDDLLEENRQLKLALESFNSKSQSKPDIAREMIFKVFHSASHLMAISKLDTGKYVDVNDSFLNVLGYSKDEIIGHTSDDIQIFSGFEESNKYIKLISKLQKVKDYEVTLRARNGVEKPYLFSAETVQLDNEVYLLTIYNEVPASDGSSLNDSQATILAEIFETVSSYLTLYRIAEDNAFYIVDLSKQVEEVESISKASVIGKCINDTALAEKVKLMELLHYLRITGDAHKLAASASGDDSEGYYMGFLLTSGKIVITWEPGESQKKKDRKAGSGDQSAREIRKKDYEEQLRREKILEDLIIARQKAELAAQSKQLFMSTMSHEIRTPLNEVIGITNLLLQGKPREDQMDYIKTLKFSGNHLLALVNDVLDYNKMESGKIVFEEVRFNLYDFLDEIVRSYSLRAKVKNLSFELLKESHLPTEVLGDQIRLNQILSNLLSNALKFTTDGGITVTVNEIKREGSQSTLEFAVSDTGIGIPEDKHASIFDSFTQAASDTTRHFGGTGLGLSICQKLVDLQGGKISVSSEFGKGSTFRFELSFKIPESDKNSLTASAADSFTGLEGKRILVAEDNKINFYVANKFLTGWGMIVTHVDTGQAVLDSLEKEDFDLVLMDLHMPVMDGIEATKIIRGSEIERIKTIPVVALTAAIMSESHDKIEGLVINDYVLKPFKPHELFDRIKRNIR